MVSCVLAVRVAGHGHACSRSWSQVRDRIPVKEDLVFLCTANDIEHHVRLHFEDNHLVVVEDNVRRLLCGFLWTRVRANGRRVASSRTQQSLFKGLLVLDRLVCNLAGVVVVVAGGRVWVGVVLGEDARAIVDGEDEDGLDAEEGERPRHGECIREAVSVSVSVSGVWC